MVELSLAVTSRPLTRRRGKRSLRRPSRARPSRHSAPRPMTASPSSALFARQIRANHPGTGARPTLAGDAACRPALSGSCQHADPRRPNNGASGITLVFPGSLSDYGYALPPTEEAVTRALQGIHLDAAIDIELEFGPPSRQAASIVAAHVRARGVQPSVTTALRLRPSRRHGRARRGSRALG